MGRFRKAIGTGIAGAYAWAGVVVASASGPITAAEWLMLGGVGVAVAACFGLTNDPAPTDSSSTTAPAAGYAPTVPEPITDHAA